jgi:hypothetical protein
MSNFDLIDDYITNRLRGEDREQFERQLANDPALKTEVELQQRIVKTIQAARAGELKAMLNKVPVGGGVSFDFPALRMAAGLVGAGVLAATLYYSFKPSIAPQDASTDLLKKTEQLKPEPSPETTITPDDRSQENVDSAAGTSVAPELKEPATTPRRKEGAQVKPVEKPTISVTNPAEELAEAGTAAVPHGTAAANPAPAPIEVEVSAETKKYDFHYQFESGKLQLFGNFDRSLFEVIEVNGGDRALFLYYKEQFYTLNEKQATPERLVALRDAALLSKLRQYRKQ